jgi:hypothetical protein
LDGSSTLPERSGSSDRLDEADVFFEGPLYKIGKLLQVYSHPASECFTTSPFFNFNVLLLF